jgi:hypothetical protein
LQRVGGLQFIHGQVTRAAAQCFIAGGGQEPGSAEAFRHVFFVVPGIEFGVVFDVNVGKDDQQGGTLFLGHNAPLFHCALNHKPAPVHSGTGQEGPAPTHRFDCHLEISPPAAKGVGCPWLWFELR